MSNMSYCRFENTLSDLEDCKEQLELLFQRGEEGELPTRIGANNSREREARIKLIELAQEIAEMIEDQRTGGREGLTVEDLVNEADTACEEVRAEFEGDEE